MQLRRRLYLWWHQFSYLLYWVVMLMLGRADTIRPPCRPIMVNTGWKVHYVGCDCTCNWLKMKQDLMAGLLRPLSNYITKEWP